MQACLYASLSGCILVSWSVCLRDRYIGWLLINDRTYGKYRYLSMWFGHSVAASSAEDSLDDYMKHIDIIMDSSTVRQIKQKIGKLRKEEQQLKRLVEIARPSSITDVTSDTHEADPARKQKDRESHRKSVNRIQRQEESSSSVNGQPLPKINDVLPSGPIRDSASKEPEVSSAVPSDDTVQGNRVLDERAQEDVGDKPRVYGPLRPDHMVVDDIVQEDDIEEGTVIDEEKAEAKRVTY